jgi:hypothetical protein
MKENNTRVQGKILEPNRVEVNAEYCIIRNYVTYTSDLHQYCWVQLNIELIWGRQGTHTKFGKETYLKAKNMRK